MRFELALSPNWISHGRTWARGQARTPEGRLLRAPDLAAHLDAIADDASWQSTVAGLNGCFAAVGTRDGSLRAAVDRVRSIPLFHATQGSTLVLADGADRIRDALPESRVDELSRREFTLTGYVTHDFTLIEGLHQLRAGHCLFADGRVVARPYYAFRHVDPFDADGPAMRERLDGVFDRVFRRLVDDIGARPIILPLSGGYDSRLIAVMLRECGARDVRCFCYGASGDWESETSREVAAHLGYPWTMIPYSAQRWRQCAAEPRFRDYFRRAGNLVSVPHVQDWPAVRELVADPGFARDAVFVPGHTGDFLTGNHIPKSFAAHGEVTREALVGAILDTHYSLWDQPRDSELRRAFEGRIARNLGTLADSDAAHAADQYECWEWQERQAKFIVNSVRVYESFGCEWRLPWWDAELMDFWSRVPLHSRIGRALFVDYFSRRHSLPVRRANADRSRPVEAVIGVVNRTGLRPLAKAVQRSLRRLRWRHHYEHDPMRWFALVEPRQFRARYTGRETGHSFFALQYLERALA